MYELTMALRFPNGPDADIMYEVEFAKKKDLHKVEQALSKALARLVKLTSDELENGIPPEMDTKNDPRLVTFDQIVTKDGNGFSACHFDWFNQSAEAREYLKGMFDGLMKEAGHAAHRRVGKGRK